MFGKVEGIVIRTTDYGETNKIITLFTRQSGKIGVMARGAKKSKSRLSSLGQLFIVGDFLVQSGSGLGTLHQGEIQYSMRSIREDIFKTGYAAYIVELTDKLTEEKKPNPYLYELLYQTLHYINEGIDYEVLTFIYELKMLQVAGIHPHLDGCVQCGNLEGKFAFSIREGGFLCQRCAHLDPHLIILTAQATKLLRLLYYYDLKRLGNISLKPETKTLLRQVITNYYNQYSGLHLKSKRFLEQLDKFKLE